MSYKIDNLVFRVGDLQIINEMVEGKEIRLSTRFSYNTKKDSSDSYVGRYVIEICKEDEVESDEHHFYIRFVVDALFSSNAKQATKALGIAAAKEAYPELRSRLGAILALVGLAPVPLPTQLDIK